MAAIVVHIGAAAIWLAGLVAFGYLGLSRQLTGAALRAAVPRFSAVALVAIGLVIVTGGYSAWAQTRDLTPLLTSYATVLDIKVVVVGLALVLGFLNLVDGGRDRGPLRGFHGRVRVEATLGLFIVGLSAVLVSGSPPGTNAPIWIDPAASTARSVAGALALEPGLPGPNRLLVQLETAVPDGGGVEVRLVRLDGSAGPSTIHLRPSQGDRDFVADGVVLGPESRWDAAAGRSRCRLRPRWVARGSCGRSVQRASPRAAGRRSWIRRSSRRRCCWRPRPSVSPSPSPAEDSRSSTRRSVGRRWSPAARSGRPSASSSSSAGHPSGHH